jgi:cytoskeleton protein RodZ
VPAAPMPTPGDTSPATGGPAASSGSADGAVVPVLQAADALQVADAGGAPAAADTAATDAAGGETSLLVLTARGESWVQVTNGRGEVVIQRVMRAGDTHDFSSTPPYTVVVGRADQMEVAVRGQPFDLGAVTRANVARFEVK